MNLEQLKQNMSQVLETYQRCGLRHIGRNSRSELPAETQEQLALLLLHAEAKNPKPESVSNSGPQTLRPEIPAQPSHTHSSGSQSSASPTRSGAAKAGSWSLPVLADAERLERLQEIDTSVRGCTECADIVSYRHQTVLGEGHISPRICFMGEAPGADEDRQGRPFVGRAGQLLTKIIAAMKLTREEVYILNALKCRPPQNRTPVPEEIDHCRPFVEKQLAILQPQYIVCLGAVAVRSLLQSSQSIGRLRGKFHNYHGSRVVVTYHPSYLLRNESAKKLVWEDMQMLMQEL